MPRTRTTTGARPTLATAAALACVLLATLAIAFLAARGAGPAQAAFPGQNGQIAYVNDLTYEHEPFKGGVQIRIIKPDGTDVRELTRRSSKRTARTPDFSPNGRRIVFILSGSTASGLGHEIFSMNARGRGLRRLTRNRRDEYDPSYSPTGRHIVFSADTRQGREIFTMRRNGRQLRRLTRSRATDTAPVWSPDGRWIAFNRQPQTAGGGQVRILIMRPNGRRVKPVARGTGPSWSPDSRRIAFRTVPRGEIYSDIFTIKRNGRGLERLTDTERYDFEPAWSPDGKWIVFRQELSELWRVPANGGKPQLFHQSPDADVSDDEFQSLRSPTWQPR